MTKQKVPPVHPIILYEILKQLKETGVVRSEDLASICQKNENLNNESECLKISNDTKVKWLDMNLSQLKSIIHPNKSLKESNTLSMSTTFETRPLTTRS